MKPKLVYVEWEDSYGCSSRWEPIDGVKPEAVITQSVGWLIHRDKKTAVIVPHIVTVGNEKQGCGDMTIPTACIRRMVPINQRPFLLGR